jgi:hypothetical protein
MQLPAGPYRELTDAQFEAIVKFPGLHFNGKIDDPAWVAMKDRMQKLDIIIHQL